MQLLSPVASRLVDTIQCVQNGGGSRIPRSFLLSGPPGVGKTFAVRRALETCSDCNESSRSLISLRGSELLATHPSDASRALLRTFRHAAERAIEDNSATVLFLDECDALLSVDTLAAILATLLDRMSSVLDRKVDTVLGWDRLVVVAATNRVDSIPVFLRRSGRFDQELPMAPPTAIERASILQSLLQEQQKPSTTTDSKLEELTTVSSHPAVANVDEDQLRNLSEVCVGYVPADLVALVRRASVLAVQERKSSIDFESLQRAMVDVGASALRDASLSAPPMITWNDIAGDPGGAKVIKNRRSWELQKNLCVEMDRGSIVLSPAFV